MSHRVPLFQLIHTPEGDNAEAYAEMYESVGVTVSDEVRRARPAGPRDTRPRPHEYGDCANGPSRCPIHRRDYRDRLESRRGEQRRAEQERNARIAAMNKFRVDAMVGASQRAAEQRRTEQFQASRGKVGAR